MFNGISHFKYQIIRVFCIFVFDYCSYLKKGADIYVMLLVWPETDELILTAPDPSPNTQVTWLGYDKPLKWDSRKEGGMVIKIPMLRPNQIPCEWAWVFKITGLRNA